MRRKANFEAELNFQQTEKNFQQNHRIFVENSISITFVFCNNEISEAQAPILTQAS